MRWAGILMGGTIMISINTYSAVTPSQLHARALFVWLIDCYPILGIAWWQPEPNQYGNPPFMTARAGTVYEPITDSYI